MSTADDAESRFFSWARDRNIIEPKPSLKEEEIRIAILEYTEAKKEIEASAKAQEKTAWDRLMLHYRND